MSKVDWCSLLGGSMDPDILVDIFHRTINNAFNSSFLIKTKSSVKSELIIRGFEVLYQI